MSASRHDNAAIPLFHSLFLLLSVGAGGGHMTELSHIKQGYIEPCFSFFGLTNC